MAVITISRGSASGGRLLAEGLAQRLGFHIVSREEIIERAVQFGVSEATLDKALLDPPSLSEDSQQNRRHYLVFIQDALCELARKDNVIYHGNAGHLLLRGISHLFRIRLIAPLEFRVQKIVERTKMTSEEAAAYIQKIDAQRRAWNLFLYGVDWLSPTLYDLTINLENMNIGTAVALVAAAIGQPEFATTPQSQKAIDDLAFATRVKAVLAADPVTSPAEVDLAADSDSGTVTLTGPVRPQELLAAVSERIQAIPAVRSMVRQYTK
jgi:cytidylate kinase